MNRECTCACAQTSALYAPKARNRKKVHCKSINKYNNVLEISPQKQSKRTAHKAVCKRKWSLWFRPKGPKCSSRWREWSHQTWCSSGRSARCGCWTGVVAAARRSGSHFRGSLPLDFLVLLSSDRSSVKKTEAIYNCYFVGSVTASGNRSLVPAALIVTPTSLEVVTGGVIHLAANRNIVLRSGGENRIWPCCLSAQVCEAENLGTPPLRLPGFKNIMSKPAWSRNKKMRRLMISSNWAREESGLWPRVGNFCFILINASVVIECSPSNLTDRSVAAEFVSSLFLPS